MTPRNLLGHEEEIQTGMDQAGMEDQDQRYWRRNANRRVRKKRFTRNFARWSLIVTLQLAFGSLVVYTGNKAWRQLSGSSEFSLQRIELAGADRAKRERIHASVAPFLGEAVLSLNLDEIEQAVRRDPWVLEASLRRVLPDTLRISVTERTPVAIAVIGALAHVVDENGFVIGPTGVQQTDDVPVLIGLPGAEDPQLAAELRRGVDLLKRLRRTSPDFVDEISELDLAQNDRITLRTIAPGPLLLLDPEHVERNVVRFLSMRETLRERVGVAAVVDLRWKDRFLVTPAPGQPTSES